MKNFKPHNWTTSGERTQDRPKPRTEC